MSAAVLLTNEAQEVLLVKPNYRDTWNLPGGVVERHESPLDGAIREVKEELAIELNREDLCFSAVDYRPAKNGFTDKLYFYFLGGILDTSSISSIILQADELDAMKFVPISDAQPLLGSWTYRQVANALSFDGHASYLENGHSAGGTQ